MPQPNRQMTKSHGKSMQIIIDEAATINQQSRKPKIRYIPPQIERRILAAEQAFYMRWGINLTLWRLERTMAQVRELEASE